MQTSIRALLAVAVVSIPAVAGVVYAADPSIISIPSKNLFPESITSTKDGTIIIGSYGTNSIWRIPSAAIRPPNGSMSAAQDR